MEMTRATFLESERLPTWVRSKIVQMIDPNYTLGGTKQPTR